MGLVKVELPFEGLECNVCMFEENAGSAINSWNYCNLFESEKPSGKRCFACVRNQLSERPSAATALSKCEGSCQCT